jgi:hypothetical protein
MAVVMILPEFIKSLRRSSAMIKDLQETLAISTALFHRQRHFQI